MAKQKGGNRTVFISILVGFLVTGIVIGVLFATGVLGKKSNTPSPSQSTPFVPGLTCDPPTVNSVSQIPYRNVAELTITPIHAACRQQGNQITVAFDIAQGPGQQFPTSTSAPVDNYVDGESKITTPLPWNTDFWTGPTPKPGEVISGEAYIVITGTTTKVKSNKIPYSFTYK
jgi:hypothetical protein